MRVLITGVNGFIASNLAKYLNNQNYEVYGTSSKKNNSDYCIKTFALKIGEKFTVENIKFDWVVHCVYDKTLSFKENTDSTISWAKELKERGINNQIFLSSISAISGNNSEYSLIKKETELWFIKNNMYVARPGLVVGNGGLFKQMIKKIKNFPIIPLVNGGISDVKLIGLNDLISEIDKVLNLSAVNKEINIFYPSKFILKDLLKEIAKFYDKKIFFIIIPFYVIFNLVRLLEILKINIGVTSQNIMGLVSNEVDIECDIDYAKDISQILEENFGR